MMDLARDGKFSPNPLFALIELLLLLGIEI